MAEKLQPIPQPLNSSPANKYASFQRISDLLPNLPGNGGQQLVGRFYRFVSGVHHQKTACSVGGLGHARFVAKLAKKSSLLVPGNACYGYLRRKDITCGGAVYFAAGFHFG